MHSRKLKTLALALAAAGAFAGSAQASVIDYDDVTLTSTGYDFGGSTWVAGAPTNSGDLHFHLDGGRVRPHLIGTIHLNDADGTCGRMRLQYYDADDDKLATKYGGTVCVDDDRHHSWSVDLDPYEHAEIASVRVSLQKQTATGWSTAESSKYRPNMHADDVKITEDGVDFGSPEFALGAPAWAASMLWSLEGGEVRPYLRGSLHLNNSSGVCARMNLRYLTAAGVFLTERAGGTVCAPDNGHHVWSVDLEPYASNKIGKVKVQLQTLAANGSYVTAGSQTVSTAE